MAIYLDLVVLLNFAVDLLLLVAADRLTGYPIRPLQTAAAALFGAAYAAACILPGMAFLANLFWRTISLAAMGIIAFGTDRSCVCRIGLFLLLTMALGGVASVMERCRFSDLLLTAAGIFGVCLLMALGKPFSRQYVTVQLRKEDRVRTLLALRDTGNMLTDPITGNAVLIVGADIAKEMLNVTQDQLQDPICTVASGAVPGARLIPYRAVGQPNGMLLAVCMDEVRIDSKPAGRIVAFAPERIGNGEGYQALTGGIM